MAKILFKIIYSLFVFLFLLLPFLGVISSDAQNQSSNESLNGAPILIAQATAKTAPQPASGEYNLVGSNSFRSQLVSQGLATADGTGAVKAKSPIEIKLSNGKTVNYNTGETITADPILRAIGKATANASELSSLKTQMTISGSTQGTSPTSSSSTTSGTTANASTTSTSTSGATAGSGVVRAQGVALEDAVGFRACNISAANASQPGKLQECVGTILRFSLIIAGVVAIVRLAVAAFDYYNPETGNNVVKDSIESIRNIFIGLMLIAGGVLILNTFNVALIDFSFLGFTASRGGSSPTSTSSGSSSTSTGANVADQKFGNIALSSTDSGKNIQTLEQALNDLKTGKITKEDFEKALKYTLDNLNLKNLPQSTIDSITGLFNNLKSANINFTPDPNLLAALNGSGNKSDGTQQKATASYCSIDACTIQGASAVGNPQVLTVTMKNKNNVPVNFLIRLNPPNQLPSPLDQYLKIKPGSTATSAQFEIIKNSVTGGEFSNWCSIASSTSGGGGTACYNSPATTTDYIWNSKTII